MTIGQRIKQRRLQLGLTADDVAAKTGKNRATIYRYESNEIEKMPLNILEALASVLQCTPAYLMGWETQEESNNEYVPHITKDYATFPVIGEIAAGYDRIADESWAGEKIDIPLSYLKGRKPEDFFVLKVVGDSMYPTYQANDKVLILKQTTLDYSGQVGAVIYNDECATLKRIEYRMGEDWMNLVPINPSYPPTRVENEKLEHCRVLGLPQLVIREIKN